MNVQKALEEAHRAWNAAEAKDHSTSDKFPPVPVQC